VKRQKIEEERNELQAKMREMQKKLAL